jgi:protein TonB
MVTTTTAPPAQSAKLDTRHTCEEPEYPSASRRSGETGTVTLRFLIDTGGHVIDSKIETSSGFARLDRAARESLSQCMFKPVLVDGKPEQSWAVIRYKWRLQ